MGPRAGAARIAGVGTSIFTEITQLATRHGAVNLGQGFPDFPPPAFVKDAAARAAAGHGHQYAQAPGLPRLRSRIAEHFARRSGLAFDPESEVTVMAGATEALACTALALVDPGDEVVVFEPYYDCYVPAIRFAGGVPRVVTLRPPRWTWDPDELRAAFTPRTRAVLLNTPHNPTGKVFSAPELDTLAALCVEHDVIAIADEVYGEIVYPGHTHLSLASRPGMRARTITVDSMGKTFGVTGWKVGWAIAPDPLTASLRAVHQFVTFCTATPLQEAAADALAEAAASSYFEDLRTDYDARRVRLAAILTAAGLPSLPVGGAYFLLADIRGHGFADGVTFCRQLIESSGVAAIPPSAFYADAATAPALARFCFAKAPATLDAAELRLVPPPARRE